MALGLVVPLVLGAARLHETMPTKEANVELPDGMWKYTLRICETSRQFVTIRRFLTLHVKESLNYAYLPDQGKTMNSLEYIAAVKAKTGIKSDYALAAYLGITRSYMSRLSNSKEPLSNRLALKFAEILEVHPAVVLLDAERERADDPDLKNLWAEILEGFPALPLRAKTGRSVALPR